MASAIPMAFLGRGVVRPFRRGAADVSNDNGIDLVRSCVAQCLGTRKGELAWRPEFGSELYKLKHRKGLLLQELARHFVTDALAKWEPRVIVTGVVTSFDALGQTLTIRLYYSVIAANVPGNRVVFKDVDQTVDVPMAA